jgi:hypothetical protein
MRNSVPCFLLTRRMTRRMPGSVWNLTVVVSCVLHCIRASEQLVLILYTAILSLIFFFKTTYNACLLTYYAKSCNIELGLAFVDSEFRTYVRMYVRTYVRASCVPSARRKEKARKRGAEQNVTSERREDAYARCSPSKDHC